MGGKIKDLVIRAASGAVLVLILVGGTLLSSFIFVGLMFVVACGAIREYLSIARKVGAKPQMATAYLLTILALALSTAVAVGVIGVHWLALLAPALSISFAVELYRKSANPLVDIAATLSGVIYIVLPISLLLFLAIDAQGYHPWHFLCFIFLVWGSDVGAYLFGVAFGRHKLFERISPKKSWEGFFGGLLCAVAIGALSAHLLDMNVALWAGAGAVVCVSGVYGDLVESMFKRSAGIKDSGSIMPGHGGFLDRFDAMLLAAPLFFLYFEIFNF